MKFRLDTYYREQLETYKETLSRYGFNCYRQKNSYYVNVDTIEQLISLIHLLNCPITVDDGLRSGGKNIFIL